MYENMNMIIAVLFIFFLGIVMPDLTRKNIFFGVTIPEEILGSPELNKIKKDYRIKYIGICGLYLIAYIAVLFMSRQHALKALGIIGFLMVHGVIYYTTFRKVKAMKASSGWKEGKKEIVIASLSNSSKKASVSSLWFIIPVCIVALNILMVFLNYNSLPQRIPMHWSAAGHVDGWADKSYGSVLMLPLTQVFLTAIMFISYKAIGWTKQQISVSSPEASMEQNRIFRRNWTGVMIVICVMINLLFTFINLVTIGILKVSPALFSVIPILFGFLVIGIVVAVAVKTGQGGRKVKVQSVSKPSEGVMSRDDDSKWKLGMIYYNPDDPSIFVEKRYGIGITINFGRPAALIGFICLLAVPILISILSIVLK